MYLRMWGRIDGVSVEFRPISANTFEVQVPPDQEDGGYICEIWVLKETGAVGYKTAVLWIVDGRLVCLRMLDELYSIEMLPDLYTLTLNNIRCCA